MTGSTSAPSVPVLQGWIDPPTPRHSCFDQQPKNLNRNDWNRRWRCGCGRVYRVEDSQRDGYYFVPVKQVGSDGSVSDK